MFEERQPVSMNFFWLFTLHAADFVLCKWMQSNTMVFVQKQPLNAKIYKEK